MSTENQNGSDAYGLETQRAAIIKYCQDSGLELVQVFEDPALSGSLQPLERPGLSALIDLLRTSDIERVVVPRLDRLSRDTMLCLWLEKEIRKEKAELISISEPYRWDDPTQKLLLTMVAAFAEFERSLITSRLSSGRKTKARQGGYAGGKAAIGYKECRGSKALTVDDDKAATVRRVFEIKATMPDVSLQKIASILNREGHTTKEGKSFYPMQVKRILDRKAFYEGIYKYSGVESDGQHKAILG